MVQWTWGDEIQCCTRMRSMFFVATGLSSSFPFTVQSLHFGLIERFVVSYTLPALGLQPDAFPCSSHLLFEHISMLQGKKLML